MQVTYVIKAETPDSKKPDLSVMLKPQNSQDIFAASNLRKTKLCNLAFSLQSTDISK